VPGLDAAGTVQATFKGVETRSQAEAVVAAWVRVRLVDVVEGALVVRAFASRQKLIYIKEVGQPLIWDQ
jgi:hypothetical protein